MAKRKGDPHKARKVSFRMRQLVPDAVLGDMLPRLREVNTTIDPGPGESPALAVLRKMKEATPGKFVEMLHDAEEDYRKRCEVVNSKRAAIVAEMEKASVSPGAEPGCSDDAGLEKVEELIDSLLADADLEEGESS
jgi:hypothetical protein